MQPGQNEYPIDYLNQIAPEQKKPGLDSKFTFIIIAAGVVVAAVVGLMLLSGGGASDSQNLATLSARMQTLQKISTTAEKNIKSGKLRSTNSTLSLFLTNANKDIEAPLLKNGIKPNSIDKSIVARESGTKLTSTLEDARLNATFDRVYAREMVYQLGTVASLMKKIYTSTKSKSLKDFLVTTDNNLKPIRTQLTDFNASTS
jgi:predicted outer membrane protein